MTMQRLDFSGIFDDAHRKHLKELRRTFGMTYEDLGKLLGCDWSTVHKWENGVSTSSRGYLTIILKQFFNGELDKHIQERCVSKTREAIQRKLNLIILSRETEFKRAMQLSNLNNNAIFVHELMK